jgi:type IV secretion system protein VirD4
MQNTSQQRKERKQKQQQKIKKQITAQPAQPINNIVPAAGTKTAPPSAADSAQNTFTKNSDYFLIGGIVLFVLIVILQKVFSRTRTGSGNGDQHGTASWAKYGDMKELVTDYQAGQIEVAKVKDFGIFPRLVTLPPPLALRHVLIAAPTGVGKSRSYFLPNVYNAGATSFIATDPKSELWELTAFNQTRPIRFAPAEPDNSAPFNFITYCPDVEGAENCAEAIVHSKGQGKSDFAHWTNAEEKILTAVFLYVAHSDAPTPLHAYKLLSSGIQTVCDTLLSSTNADVVDLATSYADEDAKFQGSILSGLTGKLKFLQNPAIKRFTSSSAEQFDFTQLRERPTQLFWCMAEADVDKLQPLTAIFFAVAMRQLVEAESRKIPVNLFFDEFANIGKIKNFENKISIFRGQGIALSAALQSISQLETVYGATAAATILENFTTLLILDSLKAKTAEEFSKALGEYTYTEETESKSKSGGLFSKKVSDSSSIKHHARRLMTADEVRRLHKKKIIILTGNLKPIMAKRLFFKNPPAEKLAIKVKTLRCPAELIPLPHYERTELKAKGKEAKTETKPAAATLAKKIEAGMNASPEQVAALLQRKPQPKQEAKPAAVEAETETVVKARNGKVFQRVEKLEKPEFSVDDLYDEEPEIEVLDYDSIHAEIEEAA